MSHSRIQMQKKMDAQKESIHNHMNLNVTGERDGNPDEFRGKGMYHQTERQERAENGYPVKTGESC